MEPDLGKFGKRLDEAYRKWIFSPDAPPPSRGSFATQNQFSAWLGINSTSLSYYIAGTRFPSHDAAQKMADKLGPWVLDLLGYPRTMPRDPVMIALVDEGMTLSVAKRKELLEKARDLRAEEEAQLRTAKQQRPATQH